MLGASSVGFELQEGGIAILFVVRIAAIVKGDGIGPSRGGRTGGGFTQSRARNPTFLPRLFHPH